MATIYNWILSSERNIVAVFLFVDFFVSLVITYAILAMVYRIRTAYVQHRKAEEERIRKIRSRRRRQYADTGNDKNLAA